MPTFRCSAGHEAAIVFSDEQVRHACPACGVDVYKYRDAVLDDDGPGETIDATPDAARPGPAWHAQRMCIAIGGTVLVAVAGLALLQRPGSRAAVPASAGPVIPVATAPAAPARAADAGADAVTITGFSAVATAAGTVKIAFRLTNRSGAARAYPALAVHWHDAPGADTVIGGDAYAHPPLPFTTADVALELERPAGATGIDVALAN
ncbi:hypothetical protein [Massilia sp. CT11-137]|uniref:hypothetical protein n=1 Tax=Massilia sp. CT11-137 TaxID=3393901 RepID=UPI0039A77C32